MKQSVNFAAFVDAFHAHQRYDNFGYEALRVIFDYLEEYEDSTGEEIELDVIAICCEFTENVPLEIAKDYSLYIDDSMSEGEIRDLVEEFLNNETSIVGETDSGAFVYIQF
jgi:hypothetical protein